MAVEPDVPEPDQEPEQEPEQEQELAPELAIESDGDVKEPFLNKYFKATIKMKVSDLHLKADSPPRVRMRGDLRPLTGGPLTGDQIRRGIFELISPRLQQQYDEKGRGGLCL